MPRHTSLCDPKRILTLNVYFDIKNCFCCCCFFFITIFDFFTLGFTLEKYWTPSQKQKASPRIMWMQQNVKFQPSAAIQESVQQLQISIIQQQQQENDTQTKVITEVMLSLIIFQFYVSKLYFVYNILFIRDCVNIGWRITKVMIHSHHRWLFYCITLFIIFRVRTDFYIFFLEQYNNGLDQIVFSLGLSICFRNTVYISIVFLQHFDELGLDSETTNITRFLRRYK